MSRLTEGFGYMHLILSQAHGVTFIKYASVLLQSLSIQLDEDFLFTLLDFAKLEGVAWGSEPQELVHRPSAHRICV